LLLDEILSKRKSSSYLLLKDVQRIAKDVEISTHKEFELALSLLHDRGMLIHLTATEILKNIVIINPQWLIDSLTKVIRDDILHRFNEGEFARVGLKEDLKRLFEYGLASRDILEYVWDQEQVDFLLDLMERTLLLSKWKFKEELLYLIPSLIKGNFEGSLVGIRCVFDFSQSFLPFGVFQRLICLLVGRISIHKDKDKAYRPREPQIYKHFASVEFQPRNVLQISEDVNERQISVYIKNTDLAASCFEIVQSMLQKLNFDVMGTGLRWETLLENPASGELFSYESAKQQSVIPWFRNSDIGTIKPISASNVSLEQFLDQIVL